MYPLPMVVFMPFPTNRLQCHPKGPGFDPPCLQPNLYARGLNININIGFPLKHGSTAAEAFPERTCEAYLLVAEQAEDAVVELHVSAVALVHLPKDPHQLGARLVGVAAFALVGGELVEGALPRAADALVLAQCHPSDTWGNVP